jgi:hypothetical protein
MWVDYGKEELIFWFYANYIYDVRDIKFLENEFKG